MAYKDVGDFRDDFFIDAVDEEYCLRCITKGHKVFFVFKQLMIHAIGTVSHRYLFGCRALKCVLHNHPSWRIYYFVRNNLILFGNFFLIVPSWAIPTACRRLKQVVCILLLEEKRLLKLRYVFLGLWDAITSNMSRRIL